MATFRVNKTRDYTVMSNNHLKEKEMSLKAKGLLSIMLSLPESWDYSISGLVAICKENESAINSTLRELKEFGYLRIDKLMPNETKSGRIEYVYNIFEVPQQQGQQKQEQEKQALENQGVENQGQLNTNNQLLKELNINKKKVSKQTSFDDLINTYCNGDNEVKGLLQDWLKVRKAKRAAVTDRAIELNLQKLDKLARESGLSVAEYLKEIICRGWQAFYKINDYSKTKKGDKENGRKQQDGSKYAEFT